MTIKFPQQSEGAAKSKMRRLVSNSAYGRIGFADVSLKRTEDEKVNRGEPREWWIEISSTHHTELTMNQMYKSNGKNW